DLPASDRFGEGDMVAAGFRSLAETNPRAAEWLAVKVHAAAAADDGGSAVLVHTVDVMQTDQGRVLSVNRLLRRADEQTRARLLRIRYRGVRFAIEARLVIGLARL